MNKEQKNCFVKFIINFDNTVKFNVFHSFHLPVHLVLPYLFYVGNFVCQMNKLCIYGHPLWHLLVKNGFIIPLSTFNLFIIIGISNSVPIFAIIGHFSKIFSVVKPRI